MRPFALTGLTSANGKAAGPVLVNDTRTDELHLDGKDTYATLATNEPGEDAGGRRVYWTTSDKTVATVDKNGTVRARTDSGECTITATLADGTESISCLVRVGVFATANLEGERTTLADAAALKASTPDSILLDAGNALHGTTSASLTGGMDMLSAFSAAGYDLQAMALEDFAYGTTRLLSDANMGSGPSLASNILNNEATAVFYRSTSWNRNRVTNGMYTIVERAGYKIGFFALNDTAQAAKISAANGEFITARDWTDTANEQITALQNAGCDAIIAVASTAPEGDWQKALLNSGVTAIIDGMTVESSANVLGAGLGLDGVAQLNLVFTQGGGCRAEVQSANVKALGNFYKAQRKMAHEFRGYLFALSDMLANGDTEAAQSYLDELKVRQTERILLVNTHNPIIDAILNQKGYAAREQDIDLHFEINDLSEVAIPSVDLTVVMSNLLDNAIEACEKLEKQQRRMTVKAIYNKSDNPPTLFFSVKNASKPVKIFGDHIPTTKPEPELHGFGLPNVMDILHKYDVFYLMDYKDGSFLFCLEWADAANEKAVAAAQK